MGGGDGSTAVNDPEYTVSVKDGSMGGEEGHILEVYAVPVSPYCNSQRTM